VTSIKSKSAPLYSYADIILLLLCIIVAKLTFKNCAMKVYYLAKAMF